MYTKENVHKAKGLTFRFLDDDTQSPYFGQTLDCLLAQVELGKGYTVKDIDDDDPRGYVWCVNAAIGTQPVDDTNKKIVEDICALARLVEEQDVAKWSDFVKAVPRWADTGFGSCAF